MVNVAHWRLAVREAVNAPRSTTSRRALGLSVRSAVGRTGVFQPYNDTSDDRYPEVFDFIARTDPKRVLSFGCSTGEELTTLRDYLPSAAIVGVDASRGNVRQARRRVGGDSDVTVLRGSDCTPFPDASFDAVLAMAVFRHGALTQSHPSCTPLIDFGRFEAAIADLTRTLRVGGVLAVEHANFAVADTRSAPFLRRVVARPVGAWDVRTPQYGPDNRLKAPSASRDLVFERITGA